MKDYNRDFDNKLQLMKDQKRTLSQTFNKNEFEAIQEEMKENEGNDAGKSCNTQINPRQNANLLPSEGQNIEGTSFGSGVFSGSK